MIAAAKAYKARGAENVYALAAHGLFLPGSDALFPGKRIERVLVSDSSPRFRLPDDVATPRLEVLNKADEFADISRTL